MPYVYQAPGCATTRSEQYEHGCRDPRCVACYGPEAVEFEWCDKPVGLTGYCWLPRGHESATLEAERHCQALDIG